MELVRGDALTLPCSSRGQPILQRSAYTTEVSVYYKGQPVYLCMDVLASTTDVMCMSAVGSKADAQLQFNSKDEE